MPLPVVLRPVPDELLSSWIARHADVYGVSALSMLRHAFPKACSSRQVDTALDEIAAARIAESFRTSPARVLAMSLAGVPRTTSRLIAARAFQYCSACAAKNKRDGAATAIQRSWVAGWRVVCCVCEVRLSEMGEGASVLTNAVLSFEYLWLDALRGQQLIEDALTGTTVGWTSAIDIVRLLLVRRNGKPFQNEEWIECGALLGAVVPGFNELASERGLPIPTIDRPILPLPFRIALLAGVSIVERAGPEIVPELQRRTIGANRVLFARIAAGMINPNKLDHCS